MVCVDGVKFDLVYVHFKFGKGRCGLEFVPEFCCC
jgi:hypothetical protein